MRILIVHSRYRSSAPSGENQVVDQEARALREDGHDVELFERNSDDVAGWGPVRTATLAATSIWSPRVHQELQRRIAQTRPDVVHIHNTFPLISGAALHACHRARVPVVATLHNYKLMCASGDFFRDGSPCHDCATGQVMPALRHGCYRGSRLATGPVVAGQLAHRKAWRELVSAYVFISASQRELMGSLHLPRQRVFVKHNFVPEPRSAPGGAKQEPEHAVVYLGRLDEAKGASFLMRGWDTFLEHSPATHLRLKIVGGGPLTGAVSAWGEARSSVDVLGLVDRAEATRLLGTCRAALITSQWEETFGLVAVEAMAAGVPPIAPDRGSFPEIVTDGVDGVLYDPRDPTALALALSAVDAAPERFAAYGRAGRSTYDARFTPQSNVSQLMGIYRFAIDNPAGLATDADVRGTP